MAVQETIVKVMITLMIAMILVVAGGSGLLLNVLSILDALITI